MNFTQFMFPSGTPKTVSTTMPDEIEQLASELSANGCSFEIECHPLTQAVFADCLFQGEELANGLCANGPDVPAMLVQMVRDAHEAWRARRQVAS